MSWNNINQSELITKNWYSIASDYTGTHLIACESNIWISRDGGATWVNNGITNDWRGAATNGTTFIVCGDPGGIRINTNGTWVLVNQTDGGIGWRSVAMNTNGTKFIACANDDYGNGSIWTNTTGTWVDNSLTNGDLANQGWSSVACDTTGTKFMACANGGSIWTNTNGTWVDASLTNGDLANQGWTSVACDSTGTKLIACADGGSIWTNTNGTWVDNSLTNGNLANKGWKSVACDSTGTKFIACILFGSIWTNTTGTWVNASLTNGGLTNLLWNSVASTGTKLLACNGNNGDIWANTNGTWAKLQIIGILTKYWNSVTSDSTGNNVFMCENNFGAGGYIWSIQNGQLVTTSDLKFWTSVACSANGNILIACTFYGSIWTSIDGGTTWVDASLTNGNLANKGWSSVACDSTGTKFIACADGGSIWTNTNGTWVDNSLTNGDLADQGWKSVATNGTMFIACILYGSIWTNTDGTWVDNSLTNGNLANQGWSSVATNSNGTKSIASVNGGDIWLYTMAICFKEGTQILTKEGYKPIQELRKGDMVQTINGIKQIEIIGKKEIYHDASQERIKQLYKCSKEQYSELFEDLIITGCHSILVDELTEQERKKIIDLFGKIYITDNKYRLPACVDTKTHVYEPSGTYTIYHVALENENYYSNYGIYANGLLVESCSKRMLKEFSGMTFL